MAFELTKTGKWCVSKKTSDSKVREPKLFIVGRGDDARYTDGARSLFAAASQPKTIRVVDGTAAHGTDLLVDAKVGSQVRRLIVDFLISHRG